MFDSGNFNNVDADAGDHNDTLCVITISRHLKNCLSFVILTLSVAKWKNLVLYFEMKSEIPRRVSPRNGFKGQKMLLK